MTTRPSKFTTGVDDNDKDDYDDNDDDDNVWVVAALPTLWTALSQILTWWKENLENREGGAWSKNCTSF